MRKRRPSHKTSCRSLALFGLLAVAWTAGSGSAIGQQLLTLGPEVVETNSIAGGEPPTSQPLFHARSVRVDIELLRSAPPQLRLPTLDGGVLVADLTRFEDRGDGDLLWSGRLSHTDYDTVVLTVAGGGLVGHFDEPLGRKYHIAASADGTGLIRDTRPLPGQSENATCGVGLEFIDPLHEHLSRIARPSASPAPDGLVSPQTDHELKILVLYTESLAQEWNDPDSAVYAGSTQAALQNAADYLTMVFRNADLPVLPTFEYAEAPPVHDSRMRDWHSTYRNSDAFWLFTRDGEIDALRLQHNADLIHLFYHPIARRYPYGGQAHAPGTRGVTADGNSVTFAHEIGHNLGGHHQPSVAGPSLSDARGSVDRGADEWTAFAFAHGWYDDGTPVPDGHWADYGTVLSYSFRGREPYFSTSRRSARGIRLGIPEQRENARAFHESIWNAVNQNLYDSKIPAPPSGFQVASDSEGRSVNLQFRWKINPPEGDGFLVRVSSLRDNNIVREVLLGRDARETRLQPLEPGLYRVSVFSFSDDPTGRIFSSESAFEWPIGFGPQFDQHPDSTPTNVSVTAEDFDYSNWRAKITWEEHLLPEEVDHPESRAEVRVYRGGLWPDGDYVVRKFLESGLEEETIILPRNSEPHRFYVSTHTFRGYSAPVRVEMHVPHPDPPSDPADPGPSSGDGCSRHVAPYWEGTGGFVVRARNGEYVDMKVSCGSESFRDTLHAGDNGLIVSLLRPPACSSGGRPVRGTIEFSGITDGGWYWINGTRNAAAAPLVCHSHLEGPRAAIPLGVEAKGDARGTLFRHDASKLVGVVPHLKTRSGTLAAPFWRGTGGIVGRAENGSSVTIRIACGGTERSATLYADTNGRIAELLRYPFCVGSGGLGLTGSLEVEGMEPGAWYWINGDRNAAVAPLLGAHQFGGAPPIVPDGVQAEDGVYGALLTHQGAGLIAIVPRIRANQ